MQHFYQHIDGFFDFEGLYSEIVRCSPSKATFVEVGSWKGKSAAFMAVEIANSGKDIDLYCVDTWRGSDEHKTDKDIVELGSIATVFASNLRWASRRVSMVQLPSDRAARCFDDRSLNFVFIDACHEYEAVKLDIASWLPKVRPDGVIAGHDIAVPGVQRAVIEAFGSSFKTTAGPNNWPSWLVLNPHRV